ncbi:MAG: sensor histidine kinase [Candidatus Levyibacteriota bacterium]
MQQDKRKTLKNSSLNITTKILQESHIFYKHLAEVTPEAVVVHSEGVIVYANDATLLLIGTKNPEDIIGQPVMKFVHPDSIPLIQERIIKMLSKRKVAPFVEEKFINLKGEIIIAETKAVPFTFQGKPAILAILHDITERKRVEQELEHQASLVATSADAIWSRTLEGIITSWNLGAERMCRYNAKEAIGSHNDFIVPPDKRNEIKALTKKILKGEIIENYETIRVTKNGKNINVSVTMSPIKDVTGTIIAVSVIARDITKQKQVEDRQLFLEQVSTILGATLDYKTTLKNISKLLVPYFADFIRIVILDENKELIEIATHHAERKMLPLVQKLYSEYRNRTDTTYGVERVMRTGKPEILEKVTHKVYANIKNMSKIDKIIKALGLTSYMGVPLKIQGKVIGVITFSSNKKGRIYSQEDLQFATEIARRIAYAIENAQLYMDAQKAIILRDEFISVASHELKTPITSLKMYTQTLNNQFKKTIDNKLHVYFEKMDQQTDKLSRLINDLLNVSKLQHGKLEFEMEKINLNKIIRDTVEEIAQTTKHTIIIEGEVEKMIYADPYRIYQVVTNLLTNAIKYSPKANKIIIRLTQVKNTVVVSVQDFGIGIEPNDQKNIFNQFYRVTSPEEKTFPGLGMGLYISKEIIKRHGGTMNVISEKGKGSQFGFSIPYLIDVISE